MISDAPSMTRRPSPGRPWKLFSCRTLPVAVVTASEGEYLDEPQALEPLAQGRALVALGLAWARDHPPPGL